MRAARVAWRNGDFANFVAAADATGVGVMLDAVFNHTSFDAEFGNNGTGLFSPSSGATYTSEIRNFEARFYSNASDYALRAAGSSSIALAPDRTDFGKFVDVHDVYFGTYSALVDTSSDSGNYTTKATSSTVTSETPLIQTVIRIGTASISSAAARARTSRAMFGNILPRTCLTG